VATLKANIIANLFGGAWIAILTIVLTPLQVRLLGIEAYGLVGLIAAFQVALGALDLGLSATITKAVSADHGGQLQASHGLVNSVGTLYWVMATAIGFVLTLASGWIAAHWLKSATLDLATVTQGIRIIAIYLALRWPIAFYAGLLTGMQRLDVLNLIKSGAASVRLSGGVIVLLLLPDLSAFLVWFALSAALELAAYAIVSHRLAPGLNLRPSFSVAALRSIWKYSLAMNLIALLSILLTQVDRLMVSKFLSLEALGYYSLAYNTAIGISILQTAVNSASFPSFSKALSHDRTRELIARYEKTSQMMGYLAALPCLILGFFGHEILAIWITQESADGAWSAMAILAVGFFLNAMVSNAYIVAIASGRPSLPLKVNLVGVALYVPALYWLIVHMGINGAAACWAGLNIYYFLSLFPLVQVGLLEQKIRPWLIRNIFSFLITGLLTFGAMRLALTVLPDSWWGAWVGLGLAATAYAGVGYKLLSPALRADIHSMICKLPILAGGR
jgi:O-antigen/teichoic acid export membrane protein